MEQKTFCYNCGNYGHIFKNCHYPIISLGIICYHKLNDEYKFILVRRKDTLGYTDFIRGKYVLNKESILNLINIMTIKEKEKILKYDLKKLWDELWTISKDEHIDEFEKSKEKLDIIRNNGIEEQNNGIEEQLKLVDIIKLSNTKYLDPEWGFPKGKREKDENNLEASIREFEEETNLKKNQYKLLNLKPVIENYIGSNNKKYRHIYYIAKLLPEVEITLSEDNIFQKTELSSIQLMSYEDVVKNIRPYNKEKIAVLESVIDTLKYLDEHKIDL